VVEVVELVAHGWNISSAEVIISSMEDKYLTGLFTAVAPVAWGTTYWVTQTFLPDRPLFDGLVRALPVGLVMLAWRRELPRGAWWWRSALLGVLNIGAFFALIFLAAHHLPGGLAATMTAISPLVVMGLAWPLAGERPTRLGLAGGVVGLVGVGLLVLRGGGSVDVIGVAAAIGAVAISAFGFVLVKRWKPPTDLLTFTSWQLVAGGLFLLPVALLVEGAPPAVDTRGVVAFAYLALVGTGLAYVAWFTGVRRLGAGPTSLIGLVNPVVGTLLGVALAGEAFGPAQAGGLVLVLGGVLAGQPWLVERLRSGFDARSRPRRLGRALAQPE
jgi:probable blue pigment (indigoidine) exporter